ncbi:MAG: hypothetical protein K9N48_08255 [Verrucomicrobia bacterium]|nr:hypothetical protein [Verrucomicrobiota bacterium]MCF7708758.1 hypothetical protein [Verrucomicrobiota bacterium]
MLLALFLFAGTFYAQQTPMGKVRGFKIGEYYSQNTTESNGAGTPQLRSLLTGAEAVTGQDGFVRVTEPHLLIFDRDGTTNYVIDVSSCIYAPDNKAAYSSERITARTGDNSFRISGSGFLWRQTNDSLVISNDVHSIIQKQSYGF